MISASDFTTSETENNEAPPLYNERYRPQFHFTASRNWLNDPNGCVYFDGEYHLFFQHNPEGCEWGNMSWGHAVSRDLVHWRQLPPAIRPYAGGMIYSGSAVVDFQNTAGFAKGNETALVAAFTHARKPFGQALAHSVDHGRSWQLYNGGEPVVPNQGINPEERDPKIFWYAPTGKWVMLLWMERGVVRFFTSGDLKQWIHTSDFLAADFYECPDLFELPVDDNPLRKKWVLQEASSRYWIGDFDGEAFTAEQGPLRGDYGKNFYAAQTWNHVPDRCVQIAWMDGGQYPGMPFNQQMTFPCELSLRTFPDGLRLCRWPVREIGSIYTDTVEIADLLLKPDQNPLSEISGSLFDISLTIEKDAASEFSIHLQDRTIIIRQDTVSCPEMAVEVPLPATDRIDLRILLDRSSIEVFVNRGAISMSSCILPRRLDTSLKFNSKNGPTHIRSLRVQRLKSIWR